MKRKELEKLKLEMKIEEFRNRLHEAIEMLTEIWDDASDGIDEISQAKIDELDTDFRKVIDLLQWYEDIKK